MHHLAIILAACITVPENPGYCTFDPQWQQQQLYDDQQDVIQQQRDALDAIQHQQEDATTQQIINQGQLHSMFDSQQGQ